MNKLKLLREEKGLYQKDLAKILEISVPAIAQYESGKRDMSTETVLLLADYFNVSTDYLLGKSEIRNPYNPQISDIEKITGLNIEGLDEDDKQEVQRTINYIKKMKGIKK